MATSVASDGVRWSSSRRPSWEIERHDQQADGASLGAVLGCQRPDPGNSGAASRARYS